MTIFLSFVSALTKLERQEVHSQNILSRTLFICVCLSIYLKSIIAYKRCMFNQKEEKKLYLCYLDVSSHLHYQIYSLLV